VSPFERFIVVVLGRYSLRHRPYQTVGIGWLLHCFFAAVERADSGAGGIDAVRRRRAGSRIAG
jgi:hypothetical protein